MKQKHITKVIPNTGITVKEFKELIYDKFNAYPMMRMNYRENQFEIINTFYDGVSITKSKLTSFCEKLGISFATMSAAHRNNRIPKFGKSKGWKISSLD